MESHFFDSTFWILLFFRTEESPSVTKNIFCWFYLGINSALNFEK